MFKLPSESIRAAVVTQAFAGYYFDHIHNVTGIKPICCGWGGG